MKVHIKPLGVQLKTDVIRCYKLITDDGRVADIYEVNGPITDEQDVEMSETQFQQVCEKYKGYVSDDSDEEW